MLLLCQKNQQALTDSTYHSACTQAAREKRKGTAAISGTVAITGQPEGTATL